MTGFTFGLLSRSVAASGAEWRAAVRRAEDLGFDVFYVSDHVDGRLSPFTALAAAGQISSRMRVGHLVLGNDLRDPVAVAHESATADILTDGRFELGIGTGWKAPDYRALGLREDPMGVRMTRLEEALRIIRTAWRGEPFTTEGAHYGSRDVPALPRPVQQPPPVLIGAGGPRMLALAGRNADIVNIIPRTRGSGRGPDVDPADCTPEAFAAKVDAIREAAAGHEVRISTTILGIALDGDDSVTEQMRNGFDTLWEAMQGSPWVFRGSARTVADQIRANRERYGLTHLICYDYAMSALAPVLEELVKG